MKKLNISELDRTVITQCLKADVKVFGKKKRARSNDFHTLDMGLFSKDTKIEELKDLAIETIRAEMREVVRPVGEISLRNHEIEFERGFKIERFSSSDIFDRQRLLMDVGEHFKTVAIEGIKTL